MQRSAVRKAAYFGLSLGLIGTLVAYADSVGSPSPATLTAVGTLTPRTRAVISGEYAYLLGQSEVVAANIMPQKFAASPTGEAVLIAAYKSRPFRNVVLPPDKVDASATEFNLIHWDSRTRTAKTLYREMNPVDAPVRVQQIEWIPQTNIALVVLMQVTVSSNQQALEPQFSYNLLRVDAGTGRSTRIADLASGLQVPNSAPGAVSASPSQPMAYVRTQEGIAAKTGPLFRSSLRVYTPQGFRAPISLPDGVSDLSWMSDGKSVSSDRIVERNAEGKIAVRKVLTVVNLETGQVTQPDKLPIIPKADRTKEARMPRDSWAVNVAAGSATLQDPDGKPQTTSALWLRAATPPKKDSVPAATPKNPISADSLLIATNARVEMELATETTAAILFTRDGTLCAAPVFRLPVTAFEEALRGVQRTATMSNAKQLGLALMMYSQDYDENLPQNGAGVADQIGPYVRNPSLFQNPGTGENGFVFSYPGPSAQSQIADPMKTQLGYVSGPGGRAIIWADGHVTWEDMP
ncbi:MAG: hypothetical protein V4671_30830 [Armatimonadota bacterium]